MMPDVEFQFVEYGEEFEPQEGVLVLDVGRKLEKGILDHHQETAEDECAATLVVKYPQYILSHLDGKNSFKIITHKYPDFDAVSSSYLALKLLEYGKVTDFMRELSSYAKLVDSSRIPKNYTLSGTPYAILYAIYQNIKSELPKENRLYHIGIKRMKIAFELFDFLKERFERGENVWNNEKIFMGNQLYERAQKKVLDDYKNYLKDIKNFTKGKVKLLKTDESSLKEVDYLIAIHPSSFLLKEWAKRDRENSPSSEGFSLIVSSLFTGNFMIAVNYESGTFLKGLGEFLNKAEEKKRKEKNIPMEFWYEGNSPFFNHRIVASPSKGTILSNVEVVSAIRDYLRYIEKIYG